MLDQIPLIAAAFGTGAGLGLFFGLLWGILPRRAPPPPRDQGGPEGPPRTYTRLTNRERTIDL